MKKDNKEKIYKTTNFHIASWLIQNNIKVKSVDWTNPRRAQFIFEDFKDRETLIIDFFQQDLIQGKITADQKVKAIMYANNPPLEYDKPTR